MLAIINLRFPQQTFVYDEISGIWLEEFSLLLNYMFPVERILNEWCEWLEMKEITRFDGNTVLTCSTIGI